VLYDFISYRKYSFYMQSILYWYTHLNKHIFPMDFKQLRYFLAVVDEGTISSAARKIPIAQPALTRQLHMLEEDLGFQLFHRTHQGIILTAAGTSFYKNTQLLLEDFETIKQQAKNIANGQYGSLRIGITPIHHWIPNITRLLNKFRKQHPDVELFIEPRLSGSQIEAIHNNLQDIGIMFLHPETQPELRSRCLYKDHMVLVTSKNSYLAQNPPTCLADLNNEDFIWFKRDSTPSSYDKLHQSFIESGFIPNIVQECSDNTTMRSLVSAGMGCTLLPALTMTDAPKNLVSYRIPDLTLELPLMLVWHPLYTTPAIEHLVSFSTAMDWPESDQ